MNACLGPQAHPRVADGVGCLVLLGRLPRYEMAVPLVQQPHVQDGADDEHHKENQRENGGDDARWAAVGRRRGKQAHTGAGQALQTGERRFVMACAMDVSFGVCLWTAMKLGTESKRGPRNRG